MSSSLASSRTPYHATLRRAQPAPAASKRRAAPEIVSPLVPDPDEDAPPAAEKPVEHAPKSRLPTVPRRRGAAPPPKPELLAPSDPRNYAKLRALRPQLLEAERAIEETIGAARADSSGWTRAARRTRECQWGVTTPHGLRLF